ARSNRPRASTIRARAAYGSITATSRASGTRVSGEQPARQHDARERAERRARRDRRGRGAERTRRETERTQPTAAARGARVVPVERRERVRMRRARGGGNGGVTIEAFQHEDAAREDGRLRRVRGMHAVARQLGVDGGDRVAAREPEPEVPVLAAEDLQRLVEA